MSGQKQNLHLHPNHGPLDRPSAASVLAALALATSAVLGGCSEKTRPVKGHGEQNDGVKQASSGAAGRAPGLDPARPGPSQAERSITQAMEIKRAEDALLAGQPEVALGHLRRALTLLPSSPRAAEIHLLTGRAHEHAGAQEHAVAAFEKAVALEPGNPAGHYLVARSYKAANDLPRAHQAIQKAITLAPKNLAYRFDRVTVELAMDRKLEAERSFTEYERRRDDLIAELKAGRGRTDPDTPPSGTDDHRVRLLALAALAAVPADEKNLKALASALEDPSAEVRAAAARGLRESGTSDQEIREALVSRLPREKDATVHKVLREALAQFPPLDPGK